MKYPHLQHNLYTSAPILGTREIKYTTSNFFFFNYKQPGIQICLRNRGSIYLEPKVHMCKIWVQIKSMPFKAGIHDFLFSHET